MSTGLELRHEGMARVVENAPADYREAALAAIEELIESGRVFCADDIRERIPSHLTPHSQNTIPALIGSRARNGRIVSLGVYRAARRTRHASKNQLWKGVTR